MKKLDKKFQSEKDIFRVDIKKLNSILENFSKMLNNKYCYKNLAKFSKKLTL